MDKMEKSRIQSSISNHLTEIHSCIANEDKRNISSAVNYLWPVHLSSRSAPGKAQFLLEPDVSDPLSAGRQQWQRKSKLNEPLTQTS